mmetsp:Transcript_20528/g.51045  ORF Transcript_20528/g.51045 Transcript_20528/m.51045 type:complete len:83 (-) Transcript_20528:61-309(-)
MVHFSDSFSSFGSANALPTILIRGESNKIAFLLSSLGLQERMFRRGIPCRGKPLAESTRSDSAIVVTELKNRIMSHFILLLV